MINFLIECILLSIAAGASAAIYYAILRYEWPINYLSKFFNDHENALWSKPLWFCVRCISGQLGLWSYFILKVSQEAMNPFAAIIGFMFTICGTICVGMAVTKFINHIK